MYSINQNYFLWIILNRNIFSTTQNYSNLWFKIRIMGYKLWRPLGLFFFLEQVILQLASMQKCFYQKEEQNQTSWQLILLYKLCN